MNTKKRFVMSYQSMISIALVSGVMSLGFQLFDGFEGVGYMLAVTGIATLIGGGRITTNTEPHLPEKSFKTAFEWLLLIIMFAMAFVMISNGFSVFNRVNDFLSTHWPGLMLSVMCIVLGLAGIQRSARKLPVNSEQD